MHGALIGTLEAIVVTPFDAQKVLLQTSSPGATLSRPYLSWKGFQATWARQVVYATASIGAFRHYHMKYCGANDAKLTGFTKLRVGMLAAVIATLVGAPFDVVKTRIQASQISAGSIRHAIGDIVKNEGAGVLWRGA